MTFGARIYLLFLLQPQTQHDFKWHIITKLDFVKDPKGVGVGVGGFIPGRENLVWHAGEPNLPWCSFPLVGETTLLFILVNNEVIPDFRLGTYLKNQMRSYTLKALNLRIP